MKKNRIILLCCILILLIGCSDQSEEHQDQATSTIELSTNTTEQPTATEIVLTNTPEPDVNTSEESKGNYISSKDNAYMVFIPAGDFEMGSSLDEVYSLIELCVEEGGFDSTDSCENIYNAELPQHTVYLDDYWIDKYEVTNSMFAAFLNDIGWRPYQSEPYYVWADKMPKLFIHFTGDSWQADEGYEDDPIWLVHWQGANDYCEWAGRRLPTEAEWEKAARGDDGRIYPWGEEEPTCDLVKTLNCETPHYFHVAVDQLPEGASPYGVFNMLGNVGEWVFDWYDNNYYSYSPHENPQGPETGEFRVVRGDQDIVLFNPRIPYRNYFFIDNFTRSLYGFRCAMSNAQ
ncbi:MAG: formylglycine-generating enzyme family protein [Anaerolineales bacterium]|nr:formylglycine-generating enzyme family protein [Anaerolineales bacterium]